MERLIKAGKIKAKSSLDINRSRLGIGFEKLDRDAFDPHKAYDRMCEIGVKWARIQAGWQKTEREKGVYDFEWFDDIVDNLLKRGIKPWVCLCYGNDLYTESAKEVYGAVGCPPIFTDEEKEGWSNYVKALVKRYKGRISHYEVWNEPDGVWCWKHGASGTELGTFTVATAKAIREVDTECEIIGGALCHDFINFLSDAFKAGMGDWIDALSFHKYTDDDYFSFEVLDVLRGVVNMFNPKIKLIQGETGSQSRSDGKGALKGYAWTPARQAKQILRQTMIDLMSEVEFCSYFSCMDMKEALRGKAGDVESYKDYGYFGVLSAQFDEEGNAIGEYKPKDSFYALQNICALFSDNCKHIKLPIRTQCSESHRVNGMDTGYKEIISGGFKLDNGEYAFAYWKPESLLTNTFEGTITFEIAAKKEDIRIADLYTGDVYTLPDDMIETVGDNSIKLLHIPIKDYPLVILFK